MERNDDGTLRLFYSSMEAGGTAVDLCSADLVCERQGAIQRVSDVTILNTPAGERRAYLVEFDPNTNDKVIYTALISADGLTLSGQTSLGISSEGAMAWGVPDAVVTPEGLVRLYWVEPGDGRASERIVSATSTDGTGTEFVRDDGDRATGDTSTSRCCKPPTATGWRSCRPRRRICRRRRRRSMSAPHPMGSRGPSTRHRSHRSTCRISIRPAWRTRTGTGCWCWPSRRTRWAKTSSTRCRRAILTFPDRRTQKRRRPGRRSDRASVSEEVRSQSSFGW